MEEKSESRLCKIYIWKSGMDTSNILIYQLKLTNSDSSWAALKYHKDATLYRYYIFCTKCHSRDHWQDPVMSLLTG